MIKDPMTHVKPFAITMEPSQVATAPAAGLTPSEEGSSLISELAGEEFCQLKRTPTPQEELTHGSMTTLKSRILETPFGGIKRHHLFKVFKWSLIVFNGLLIFGVIYGIYSHFSEIKMNLNKVEKCFSSDFKKCGADGLSPGPKYAWVAAMATFALLLTIPCIGFIGAIKEHSCLLIFYGVIFFVNAFVILMFKSILFFIPAFFSLSALGLVFLIQSPPFGSTEQVTPCKDSSLDGSKYRKWPVQVV